nr:hypothetical protein [Bacilli bacterium]
MSIKNMALIGMGMMGTLIIQKYGMPMAKKTKKVMDKKMKDLYKQMDKMM